MNDNKEKGALKMEINENVLIKVCNNLSNEYGRFEVSDLDIVTRYNKLVSEDNKITASDVEDLLTCELGFITTSDRVDDIKDDIVDDLEMLDFDEAIDEINSLGGANEENYFDYDEILSYETLIYKLEFKEH